MNPRKVLEKALAGSRNIRFADIIGLAGAFGFRLSRVSGSHHIFVHKDIPELLNLQDVGGKAKPYQEVWGHFSYRNINAGGEVWGRFSFRNITRR